MIPRFGAFARLIGIAVFSARLLGWIRWGILFGLTRERGVVLVVAGVRRGMSLTFQVLFTGQAIGCLTTFSSVRRATTANRWRACLRMHTFRWVVVFVVWFDATLVMGSRKSFESFRFRLTCTGLLCCLGFVYFHEEKAIVFGRTPSNERAYLQEWIRWSLISVRL